MEDLLKAGIMSGVLIAYLCIVDDTESETKKNGGRSVTIKDSVSDRYTR